MEEVLLINYTGSKGGGALYALEMTRALLKEDVACVAIIASHNEDINEWKKLPLHKLVIIDTYKTNLSLIKNSIFFNEKKKLIKKELGNYCVKAIFIPMITFWSYKINKIFPEANSIIALHDPIAHTGDFFYYIQNILGQQKVLRQANSLIVLSPEFITLAEKKYSKKEKVYYLPMGNYDYYDNISSEDLISPYNPNHINFIFFGRISKYKGLMELGKAFSEVCQISQNTSLTVAASGDFTSYSQYYSSMENVNIVNEWIGNDEVKKFFKGENLICVLPYRDATQSGVIQICKSFGVPIIASRTGGLVSQLSDFNDAYLLVEPGDHKDLAQVMIETVKNKKTRDDLFKNAKMYKSNDEWENGAIKIIELMDQYKGEKSDENYNTHPYV